ncbi:MAG: hypothetical protein ABJ327_07320 [Litoreibacter sp.]
MTRSVMLIAADILCGLVAGSAYADIEFLEAIPYAYFEYVEHKNGYRLSCPDCGWSIAEPLGSVVT